MRIITGSAVTHSVSHPRLIYAAPHATIALLQDLASDQHGRTLVMPSPLDQ
jgi:hypothetical protein